MSEDKETIEETATETGQADASSVEAETSQGADGQTTQEGQDKAPEAAAEPEAPAWTPTQLSAMRRHGVDPEALAPLGDKGKAVADKLVEVYADQSRRYAQIGRAQGALGQGKPTDAKPADGDLPEEINFGDDTMLSESDQKILSGVNKAIREMREQFGPVLEEHQQRTETEQHAAWDRFFDSFGEAGHVIFGKGAGSEFGQDSPEMQARHDLLSEAEVIQVGHEKVHGKNLPESEALQRAARILYPALEPGAAPERKKPTTTPRPSQTRRPPTDQTQAAMAAMGEADKRHGGGFFLD
ncbi:MAG: hypothetical protein V2A79_14720 [Planctomycetota bacterium]